MNLELEGRTVLVAGSSRGIGRAIAEALLAEGAAVVMTGRDAAVLAEACLQLQSVHGEARVLAIAGDLSKSDDIAAALAQARGRFRSLDHVVANIGTGSGRTGWDPPAEDWQRLFEQNFFAAVRLSQAVLPELMANPGGGSILYIASITGVEATPAPLPYSAAKAALINYAKNLARQLGPHKVRVNTIAPGNIWFEGGVWDAHLSERREAVEAMLRTEVPQRRFGSAQDIAALAAFLCSPKAGFATGGCYVIDGGQTRSV